jgi:hypothetical protein
MPVWIVLVLAQVRMNVDFGYEVMCRIGLMLDSRRSENDDINAT